MVFDLGGQWVEGQTETFNEVLSDDRPVGVWDGGDVSRVGSGGAIDLAQILLGRDTVQLTV